MLLVGARVCGAQTLPPHTSTQPAQARAILHEILETPEFARTTAPSLTSRMASRIRAWLRDLLERTGLGAGTGQIVATALAWAVAILVVAGLLVLIVRGRRRLRGAAPQGIEATDLRQSSRAWVDRAQQALAAGDARNAVRCAHMAVVLRFEEQGLWHRDQARTPREYVRLLPVADRRRAPFDELTREFERSWYGTRAADGSRLWHWLEACGCPARHPAI